MTKVEQSEKPPPSSADAGLLSGLETPPGPRGGRVRNMRRRLSEYMEFMEELHREYGEIVSFQLPFMNCCVVFDAEMIREVLVEQQPSYLPWFPGAADNSIFRYGAVGSTTDGEMHRKRGELMESAFSKERLGAYTSIVGEQTAKLLEQLHPGTSVNIATVMDRYTWHSVAGAILGRDFIPPRQYGQDLLELMKFFGSADLLPGLGFLKSLPWPAFRRTKRGLAALDAALYGAIERARDPSTSGESVIAHYVRARDLGIVDWSFSDWSFDINRAIRDEMIVLLCAYIDAPTAALTFGIHHIAANPDVRARLEQEVDSVLGDRPLDESVFEKLVYTRAVFSEVLRVEPPAYVMLPKEVTHDTALGGYRIPKGTLMHVGMRVLHHKADYWDNPRSFRPERWLEDPPPVGGACPAHAYIPFGDGPHACRGAGLAERIFVSAIAGISRRRRLLPDSADPPKREDMGVGIKLPYFVTVTER